jgi:hypothetical protein
LKNIKIGLADKSHIYLSEAKITYVPDSAEPRFVEIDSVIVHLRIPYYSVDYIVLDHEQSSFVQQGPAGWMPIKTAPRNGKPLWGLEPGKFTGLMVPRVVTMCSADNHGEVWMECGTNRCALPTHWMLPISVDDSKT